MKARLAGAALTAGVLAVVAIVLASESHGRDGPPASVIPPGYTTATVTRRTLSESASVDGTLGYGATTELYDRLSGTFTWLPAVGATIVRGGTLFRVDDLPVVLMYGSVPAYRTLKEGVAEGPDVAQLNENLIRLGYDPYGAIAEVSDFGAATAAAVRRWQKAEGLPETGEVELGRVVFSPDARRVTTVHVTLGQDPPAAKRRAKAKEEAKAKEKAKSKDKSKDKDAGDGDDGSAKEPAGSPSKEPGGSAAAQAEVVLTTTSTEQLVQLKLKAEQQQLAQLGELAPVALPGGGSVEGRIVEVGTVASEAKSPEAEKGAGSSGEESATIPVTLVLTRRVPHLDEAPVSVELVKSVREGVLAVPATALFATAGGRYAIEVLEGGRRRDLPVAPGMFADGYVQVEGAGLHEGQTVIESE
jgi:membrane fusion protein, multidrug efflux system